MLYDNIRHGIDNGIKILALIKDDILSWVIIKYGIIKNDKHVEHNNRSAEVIILKKMLSLEGGGGTYVW